jgi:hypothetical protein
MSKLKGSEVDVPLLDGEHVEQWMAKNFDPSWLDEPSLRVRVAFRTVAGANELGKNKHAAWLTSRKNENFPAGFMCHAELILPVSPDRFVKCSVIKKYYVGKDDRGRPIFKPGCVHCVESTRSEWKSKYVILTMTAKRTEIEKGLRFCLMNNGMPFNTVGYYANLLIPGGIGVHGYEPSLLTVRRKFFCTEFITAALQVMVSDSMTHLSASQSWQAVVWRMNPATSNPNMLYRLLKKSNGVYDDVDLGKTVSLGSKSKSKI